MLTLLTLTIAHAGIGYLTRPDIHGDLVVFVAGGDLWTAPVAGGSARRLTGHVGAETSPKFSPDGKWIAFTGEYDGNVDAFVVPVDGGEPRRLTWFGSPDDVVGWTPDGRVIFRSNRTDPNGVWRLFTIATTGGDPVEVPIGWASRLDIDPKSGRFAFTRLGREAATWKRYRGGTADDLWVGDPKLGDYRKITNFDGPDSYPMWSPDGKIVFLSDQGGTANLWSINADGTGRQALTQLTTGYDARFPSMGPDGRVVFGHAGDLWLYDPANGKAGPLSIDLPIENHLARVRYTHPGFDWFSIAPDGDRLLIEARGEVFSVPTKPGVTLSLTGMSGARESWPSYSPDGKKICYVTDASGEEAVATADAWGRGEEKTIVPPAAKGWHFPPQWSPDGKRIAYSDETQTLFVVLADGSAPPKAIDQSLQEEIRAYAWSPDGRFLAYAKRDRRDYSAVYVWDSADGSVHVVGGTNVDNSSPAWDPDGRYLYFLSSRWTNPYIGQRDFDEVLLPGTRPFVVLLKKDAANPFADNAGLPPGPENAQAAAEKAKREKKKKDKKLADELAEPSEQKPTPVVIDWEGLDDRIVAFPVDAGAMWGLSASATRVYWVEGEISGMHEPSPSAGAQLVSFQLESKKVDVSIADVSGYELAPKAKKVAFVQGGELYVVDGDLPSDLTDARVRTEDAVLELDPREEWKQIFDEAWRHERDFFWDPALGGLDWKAIHDRYAALLPRLSTRGDLNDLLGEMIGELGTSHTYVGGGDAGAWPTTLANGTLGADFVRKGAALEIVRIYHGDPADNTPAPLLEPGAGVREGDYLLAIDHVPVRADVPVEAMLQGRGGKRVLLTINNKPSLDGAREVAVTPLGSEADLRYVDWVRHNREAVFAKTDGKIGYLHVPDMGQNGLVRFETWLYPQSDREGLVVDVRWNRGGFVSQLLLDKLRRPTLGFNVSRAGGVWRYPAAPRQGPFVVVTNSFAGSDGDIFPRAVQLEGLAPVIGERSWGGVVGIRGDKPMVDGGFLTQPEYAFWFREGGWSVENHGVDPDLVVPWDPKDVADGRDTQLDAAIAEVLKRLAAAPPLTPPTDRTNDKSRDAYEKREK